MQQTEVNKYHSILAVEIKSSIKYIFDVTFKLHNYVNYVVEMRAIPNLIMVDGCLLLLYYG